MRVFASATVAAPLNLKIPSSILVSTFLATLLSPPVFNFAVKKEKKILMSFEINVFSGDCFLVELGHFLVFTHIIHLLRILVLLEKRMSSK